MLAQSFKTASELNLRDDEYDALQQTLVQMETEELEYVPFQKGIRSRYGETLKNDKKFNMAYWIADVPDCGTVACICGTAELISGVVLRETNDRELKYLFLPFLISNDECQLMLSQITIEQAGRALRNYLTTGKAMWKSVLPEAYHSMLRA